MQILPLHTSKCCSSFLGGFFQQPIPVLTRVPSLCRGAGISMTYGGWESWPQTSTSTQVTRSTTTQWTLSWRVKIPPLYVSEQCCFENLCMISFLNQLINIPNLIQFYTFQFSLSKIVHDKVEMISLWSVKVSRNSKVFFMNFKILFFLIYKVWMPKWLSI